MRIFITCAGAHAGHADKDFAATFPTKSPASVTAGKSQRMGQQKFHKAKAAPIKPQRPTTPKHVPTEDPDPEFPPGFSFTWRVHNTQEFPGLATESNKTHPPTPDFCNSTSAAGQLSFSLAATKTTQTPSPPSLSKVLILPPGLNVASHADSTAHMPLHTNSVGAESDSHEPTSNNAPVAAHCLSNLTLQQSGSCSEQPQQQKWDQQSGQLHQARAQSGWDTDSDSEPGAAWTVSGNNQCMWDTHSHQENEASSISKSGWQPDQFQGTAANGTGFFTPTAFQKPQQQQRMHSIHQYSPDPLARSPFGHNKEEPGRNQKMPVRVGGWNPDILQGQKAPYRVGGWNPDRYQGTGVAAFSDAGASTVQNQWQHPSALQDDSLKSLLSFAFPEASGSHSTSETRRSASAHALVEQQDPDLNESLSHMHIQHPTSSFASNRQKRELGVKSADIRCPAIPLLSQKASQMQSQQHQTWNDSSTGQSRLEILPAFPGGFGLRPSHCARSSEGTCEQSPTHRFASFASEKDSVHSSSTQHATNGSACDDSSEHDRKDQQHSLSRQHSQDLRQLEGAMPLWGHPEGDEAEGAHSEKDDDARGGDPDGDDAKGNVHDAKGGDLVEASLEGDDAKENDSEGVNPKEGNAKGGDPDEDDAKGGDGKEASLEGDAATRDDPKGVDPCYITQVGKRHVHG